MEIVFHKYSPAGNVTALIVSEVSRCYHSLVAQHLMNSEGVEQVAFLEQPQDTSASSRVQMMGGEFSGNGLASAALCTSELGRLSEVRVESSGLEEVAHVTIDRLARGFRCQITFALREFGLSQLTPDHFLVSLSGISHVIALVENTNSSARNAQILLQDMGPPDDIASGMIFARQENLKWVITPFVAVRGVNSFVAESACASGSLALGLVVLHQHDGPECKIQVIQPSSAAIGIQLAKRSTTRIDVTMEIPVESLTTHEVWLDIPEI
ncbi:MAG: hypothetical protein H0T73_13100 [Ardenticatenales bacterium]|nr:hypothetical protein [Ardenticatenales bacterium]